MVGDYEIVRIVPEHFHQSAASTGNEGDITKDFSTKVP
jgi:hypothetical protein